MILIAKYFLALNPDMELEDAVLTKLTEAMNHDNKLGSATAKILKWDFTSFNEASARQAKNKLTNIVDSLGIKIYKNHRATDIGQGEKDDHKNNEPEEIFGLSGAASFFRKNDLEKAVEHYKIEIEKIKVISLDHHDRAY